MKNKKGFMAVYACLFFLTLISVATMFLHAAKTGSMGICTETLGRVWAQAVLAEYDLNLQRRYHIFGYYGSVPLIKQKLDFYASETFEQRLDLNWNIGSCSLYDYSLRNTKVLEKQMIEGGRLAVAGALKDQKHTIEPVAGHKPGDSEEIFSGLPSQGSKDGLSVSGVIDFLQDADTLKECVESGSDTYFQLKYILTHFKDGKIQNDIGDTYLQQEIPYIICGKRSDQANEKALRNRIIALREGLNLSYLNSREEMRSAALALAQMLTPGPSVVVTQQTLLAVWALAESINDYNLLMEGYHVPLLKSDASWAVDLDSAINNEEETCIFTGIDEGESYEDYLYFFLSSMEKDVRTLRVMDLIQINMRWLYYDTFMLADYHGGISFVIRVDGEAYEVEEIY